MQNVYRTRKGKNGRRGKPDNVLIERESMPNNGAVHYFMLFNIIYIMRTYMYSDGIRLFAVMIIVLVVLLP
ncbi:hypothetical protein GA0061071_105296 [Kosakonia oryzendophytica]|uniref:Uncharacterized protein n=1 Tax=Kosakonia oryzendophytica TaxID=1005665 RepID=A0A1C4BS75_9ENTR|nr:hypothetical protein GA0061071_105296 [Kosakonia oryzendophytica]